MFYVFILLFAAFVFARLCSPLAVEPAVNTKEQQPSVPFNSFAYFLLLLLLILFSGTRTVMNDTALYILSFKNKIHADFSGLQHMDFALGANPGFVIYQTLSKTVFGEHFAWFLLISATIVIGSYLSFFRKYSRDFGLTIFIFIASTCYHFTMAAQKQVIATAVGLWSFRLMLKQKWLSAYIVLFIAMTFHPYVFMFAIIPFVIGPVWKGKSVLILGCSVLFVSMLQTVMSVVTQVTESFGDHYDLDAYIADGVGVNIFRLAVFSVVPVLSFIFRNKINAENDKVFPTCCNLSLVSFAFMFIAAFTDPNSFGRLAGYFEPFICVALAGILSTCFNEKNKPLVYCGCYIGYMGVYYVFYLKYGRDLFIDYYQHINLLNVIF